jgi:hypothetical protein
MNDRTEFAIFPKNFIECVPKHAVDFTYIIKLFAHIIQILIVNTCWSIAGSHKALGEADEPEAILLQQYLT